MKKLAMVLVALTMVLTANAQFESGKWYVNTSLTGVDLSYNGSRGLHLGIDATAGYFLYDNWQVNATVGINTQKDLTALVAGVGARYYIIQNGIFLGARAQYRHGNGGYNDLMPGIEVGYAFFINRKCTIEPAIYYDQSFNSHKNYSTVGLKIGIALYSK